MLGESKEGENIVSCGTVENGLPVRTFYLAALGHGFTVTAVMWLLEDSTQAGTDWVRL